MGWTNLGYTIDPDQPTMADFSQPTTAAWKKGAKEGLADAMPAIGKMFLDGFMGKSDKDTEQDKYRNTMISSMLSGKSDSKASTGSTSTGGYNNELFAVHHPSSQGGMFTIPGEPPREGVGSKLAKAALMAGIGAATGGVGAALAPGAAAGAAAAGATKGAVSGLGQGFMGFLG